MCCSMIANSRIEKSSGISIKTWWSPNCLRLKFLLLDDRCLETLMRELSYDCDHLSHAMMITPSVLWETEPCWKLFSMKTWTQIILTMLNLFFFWVTFKYTFFSFWFIEREWYFIRAVFVFKKKIEHNRKISQLPVSIEIAKKRKRKKIKIFFFFFFCYFNGGGGLCYFSIVSYFQEKKHNIFLTSWKSFYKYSHLLSHLQHAKGKCKPLCNMG